MALNSRAWVPGSSKARRLTFEKAARYHFSTKMFIPPAIREVLPFMVATILNGVVELAITSVDTMPFEDVEYDIGEVAGEPIPDDIDVLGVTVTLAPGTGPDGEETKILKCWLLDDATVAKGETVT